MYSGKNIYGIINGKNIYEKNNCCKIIDHMIVQETNNMELDNMYKDCRDECDILKEKIKDLENKLATKLRTDGENNIFNVLQTAKINSRYMRYIKLYGEPLNWNFDEVLLNSLC